MVDGVGIQMERINYHAARATWSEVTTTKKDGTTTTQWRAQLRYWQGGKRKTKSKLFPADRVLDTERKKSSALKQWINELDAEQDRAEAEERDLLEKQEAERLAAEEAQRLAREAAERASLPSSLSVGDYAEQFVDTMQKQHDEKTGRGGIQRSTASTYRQMIRRIKIALPMALSDLTAEDVQMWVNDMADEGLSPRTRIKNFRFLNHVCKDAVNKRQLKYNPCDGVIKPSPGNPDPNALTAASDAKLVKTLEEAEATPVITAAALALFAGLRQGECCGLRWRHYDEANGKITIVEAIGRDGGKDYSKVPKTARSKRSIKVSRPLARMLSRRKKMMHEELETFGLNLDDEEFGELYVCGYADGTGRFYSPTLIGRGWKELSESWGLMGTKGRRVVFHDLRHSAATLALENDTPLADVSKMLGHARTSTTADFYVSDQGDDAESAVNAIANAISEQGGATEYTIPAEAAEQLLRLLVGSVQRTEMQV